METQTQSLLTGHSEREKGAYLAVLASLATADREADPEEIEQLRELARAAELPLDQETLILQSASDPKGMDLKRSLDVIKESDLKYSLITDLIALAKADGDLSQAERANIDKIASYLHVDQQQVGVMDQFVDKAAASSNHEEIHQQGFFDKLGMGNQFSKSGLNAGSMGKGLMGMLGPMILGGVAAKALGGRRSSGGLGGGMLGGALGGMLGGGNSRGMGGGMGRMGGGLGSLISGMNRSRSGGGLGSLLGRLM